MTGRIRVEHGADLGKLMLRDETLKSCLLHLVYELDGEIADRIGEALGEWLGARSLHIEALDSSEFDDAVVRFFSRLRNKTVFIRLPGGLSLSVLSDGIAKGMRRSTVGTTTETETTAPATLVSSGRQLGRMMLSDGNLRRRVKDIAQKADEHVRDEVKRHFEEFTNRNSLDLSRLSSRQLTLAFATFYQHSTIN